MDLWNKKGELIMPTGYTCQIEDGNINTGKEFILECAKAFGGFMGLDGKEEHTPSTYYKDKLESLYIELIKLESMSLEDVQKLIDYEYYNRIKSAKIGLEKYKKKMEKYNKVLLEVKMWTPPTEDHVKLKEFAINQIEISTEYDGEKYYLQELKASKISAEEYLSSQIEYIKDDIKRCNERWVEEIKSVESKNKWIRDLKNSL